MGLITSLLGIAVFTSAVTPTMVSTAPAASAMPERWRTGAVIDADRSGDLRPSAIALIEAVQRQRGLATSALFRGARSPLSVISPPETIRVWRRAVDGSTSSCDGRVDVIPFEQYVKGVLPAEWVPTWQPASLQAGAVAIRTYAAWWVAAGGKYLCSDVDDTTASQVYKDKTTPLTSAAVDATAGLYVVDAAGDLVFAEYSAENSDPTEFGVVEPYCTGQPRNGHGRGLCQWGSQRWVVNELRSFDWIVLHYYPGSAIYDSNEESGDLPDAGPGDGSADAGPPDGGPPAQADAGPRDPGDPHETGGCGCTFAEGGAAAGGASALLLVAALASGRILRRRRTRGS